MTRWWSARLPISELRRELREMIECDDHADDAREALACLRGVRGKINYVDAASTTCETAVKATIADAGARLLCDDED